MHVVATAGHVDHGKSTLVEALTGRHPDRLSEERSRGLSIELGYCWTTLPGIGEVAFVDVPGHQRFLTTALAGMGPVPVAMLVIAADDPWMPQAAEHLAALDALGVEHGVLVVTRSDLADPAPMLERGRRELDGTSLTGATALPVSARTGAGLDLLRATLTGLLADLATPPTTEDVRLWVDRRFHVRGTGTVVTGTLPAGAIAVGDVLAAGADRVRVRGIEALEVPRPRVSGPARVALDLGGRVSAQIDRGTALVTPDGFCETSLVDVRVGGGPEVRHLPEQPLLHVGSAALSVHLRPLGGEFVRLRIDRPLPLRVGDRVILRDPGSRRLWGARVVDPLAPPLGRRGAAAARAQALAERDGSLLSELTGRGVVRASTLERIGVPTAHLPDDVVRAGDWLVAPGAADTLRGRLALLVDAVTPMAPPLTTVTAARELGLPAPELVSALVRGPLREANGLLLGPGSQHLPANLETALAALRERLADAPFAAPDRNRMRELGLDPPALAVLDRAGRVLRLPDDVVLLPGADEDAVELLRALPQPFTTSMARRALSTSRRVALPVLAYLDRTGRTVRLPDDTRRVVTH